MDSSFSIRVYPVASRTHARRNPATPHEAPGTEVDPLKAVAPAGDHPRDAGQEHLPQDVVADPESREVINRENDIRVLASPREHPDQALLRQRAYRPAPTEPEHPSANEPLANIKA